MPAPPGDPKALLPPLDLADLARFRLTDLETGPIQDFPLGDVGASVSLLEPERYMVPGGGRPGPLHPADAALVAAASASAGAGAATAAAPIGGGAASAGAPAPTASTAPRPGTELAWLMRTTYIHADTVTRAGRERGAAAAAAAAAVGAGGGGGATTATTPAGAAAAAAAAIDAEFEAAARPPVHPTKPWLKAVRVLHVLPDLAGWAGPGPVLVAAGADPLAGVTRGAALGAAAAARAAGGADTDGDPDPAATARLHAWLASRAAMKSYTVPAPAAPGGRDTFIAFMVPASAPADADLAAAGPAAEPPPLPDPDAIPYDWVREFGFRVEKEGGGGGERTFLFDVREDAVYFTPLGTRIALHPRPPPPPGAAGGEDEEGGPAPGFVRPSGVTLQRVARGEREEAAAAKRLAGLLGGEGRE